MGLPFTVSPCHRVTLSHPAIVSPNHDTVMNTLLLTALLPLGCGEGTMPPPPPAPLLFVRVVAPEGTKVVFDALPGHDRRGEPRLRGRPVLIVRLGERDVPPAELFAVASPGTVLVPGDAGLPPPACPPTLPAARWLWFDPILGPKKPLEE